MWTPQGVSRDPAVRVKHQTQRLLFEVGLGNKVSGGFPFRLSLAVRASQGGTGIVNSVTAACRLMTLAA